ncbi:hypothetical protein [Glutamicibacter arilaitensis]|uniref:AMP-binding enzyme C-terminal domain-containing protein n=1 Tax=Glutamicibacter arilaitensis TaxID=256701 RepID=A0A2N7RXZ6_9MICC|nr:hypothetical protein [Glutamicibacter arilaitensis]PMQ18757.1 hypothetical protein CIK84_18445 [Glutamicibacter arilaitensis]
MDASGALRFPAAPTPRSRIRGYRIEPGEVQGLATDPRVGSAAVLARRMPQGHVALIGYVVPRAGADTEEARAGVWSAVRASARRELPD